MKANIKIAEADFEHLRTLLLRDAPEESAAFVLAGVARHGGTETLLARRVIEIPREMYRIKGSIHLDISPQAINGLVALCEANRLGVILCHSHPGHREGLNYSPSDDHGESRIAETLRKFLPDVPVGSLLVSENAIRGRVWPAGRGAKAADQLIVLGHCIRRYNLSGQHLAHGADFDEEIFGRQALAFGKEGQALLAATKVAVVGVGGTGSPAAEQLVRMGVRDLVLIDNDIFSASNVTRVYGSFARHASPSWFHAARWKKQRKVEIVARHLRSIHRGIKVEAVNGNVLSPKHAAMLLDRDVIFLCTDEQWGRSLVNQIAYQYMIPTYNLGVRIDAPKARVIGGTGIVHVLRPGRPCLWCYEYLRADIIRAESLEPEERLRLAKENYVTGLGSDNPSVVSITSTVASHAANLFLQMVTDFMGMSGAIDCLRHDVLEGHVRRGTATVGQACQCRKVSGFGDLKALNTCADQGLLDRIAAARRGGKK